MSEREMFMAALDLPVTERSAYLNTVCGKDEAVRSRIEALLHSHEAADSFLGTPAVAPHDPDSANTRTMGHEGAMTDNDETPLGFLAPATRPDSLGRIGHYEVLQVLGQGGFGIVFRAFDEVLHRVVAVKVLSPQMAATSPARKRFLREARSSAQVRHENVVQVYEVGETPLPYIAMEFVPGETLQQRLDRAGPVDVVEVLRIGRQIAEGLAAAHAADLIHRDIKPANILLEGGAQRVKITDFGLARAADDASISQSGIIAGTPMYMAPEQAKGETLDQRADLFSLGSVLYQMTAGRPPFRATGTLAVLKRVAEDTPRSIREIVPETPQWLCDIIAKLHAKNPDDRYQSAREVADVLADCEAQLKANSKLKDFSRIPKSKQPAAGKSGRWKWVAAAALLLPLIAFAMTELAGVTHLIRVVKVEPTGPAESLVPDDKARLQGRWRMVALEQNGKPMPVGEHVTGYQMEFIGDTRVTHNADGKLLSAPFALNPGADPKELSILTGIGPIRHIYRFDGDKLIFALGGLGRPRPTGFTTTPDTSLGVATWVRDTGPMPGQTGWVQLFNGKDKTGWKTRPEAPGQWEVNDGILMGSRLPSVLYSDRGDYANFHLRAEIKINQGGDSGVFFRVGFGVPKEEIHAQEWEPDSGFEVEILKTSYARKTGSVTAVQPNGPPVILGMTADDSLTRPDEWFTLEIHVEQDRFITKVNGKETANCRDPRGKLSRGHIGLQVWSPNTVVQFRKIELKELPAVTPAPAIAPFDAEKAKEHQEAWAKHLGVQVEYKNSIGMEFVKVPKGKSWLGGGKDKLGDKEVAIPADFYLGKYEVTQDEWEKVMGENPSHFSRTGEGKDAVKDIPDADLKRFPVENVSWDQCQIFIAKLNKREKEKGWVYRLPTEAEWEYACRGGPMADKLDSAFDFHFAKPTNTLLLEQANFNNVLKRACKVGSYVPNLLGLYDMHGNNHEWCDDAEKAADGASRRVRRGGNWYDGSGFCRAAGRDAYPPSLRGNGLGLRLARVPSGTPSPEATPPLAVAPFTDADVKRIAALPAAEQVEEVRKELVRRNPGFDGKVEHKIEDGVVTELRIVTDKVTDVAPIRVFSDLRVLNCSGTETNYQGNGRLADLTPLKGMNLAGLTQLNLSWTKVDDVGLALFKDCRDLKYLLLGETQVSDIGLAYFKDCKSLKQLELYYTQVSDTGLALFKDCKKLTLLHLASTKVSDLGMVYFKECKDLAQLYLHGTQVSDVGLAHLKDCKNLRTLYISNTKITDLKLLKEMPLKQLICDFQPERDAEILRSIKTLETINGKPVAEFWKDIDKK